ncbi:MAG: 50S ribosomal protein L25/general stress protein Ctc [Longimicrobiales bacterium]
MTMTKTLNATKRDATGKGAARKFRQQGRVPAVVYGKDLDSIHLTVDAQEALHLFETISVENTIVELAVDGDDAPHQTLVREIQAHPFRRELIHIDFLRVQAGVMVELEIPVHLEGTPVGVKQHGGVLDHVIHELPVKCIPSKIPDQIVIDVSHLDVNEAIHVSDLDLGEGVEITISPEQTICGVSIPKTPTLDAEEAAAEEAAEPELVGEDEDGAEGDGEDSDRDAD